MLPARISCSVPPAVTVDTAFLRGSLHQDLRHAGLSAGISVAGHPQNLDGAWVGTGHCKDTCRDSLWACLGVGAPGTRPGGCAGQRATRCGEWLAEKPGNLTPRVGRTTATATKKALRPTPRLLIMLQRSKSGLTRALGPQGVGVKLGGSRLRLRPLCQGCLGWCLALLGYN